MRVRGLEPPRVLPHQNLNLARLPISPHPRRDLECSITASSVNAAAIFVPKFLRIVYDRDDGTRPTIPTESTELDRHGALEMKFSQFAGTSIVPTLARVVLALAFVTIGYHKVFGTATFTAQQANILYSWGVEATPISTPTNANSTDEETVRLPNEPIIHPAAFIPQEENPTGAGDPLTQDDDESGEEASTDDEAGGDDAVIEEHFPLDGTMYEQKALYSLALLLHAKEMPRPDILCWVVAVTELGGGALLLIGFFSRVWGLGLAITMGAAFALTTFGPYFGDDPMKAPFEAARIATEPGESLYFKVFMQLSTCVLALGIFLTGPGPLSLDRLIFGRGRDGGDDDIPLD